MSQLERVIAVMSDGKERTLRDIEHAIWWRYHIGGPWLGERVHRQNHQSCAGVVLPSSSH